MTKRVLEPNFTNTWRSGCRLSLRPIQRDADSNWCERQGHYHHPLGTVAIWQGWAREGDTSWTTLEVVDRDGYVHIRQWKRVHPHKTVSRLARMMIEELIPEPKA